MALTLHMPTTFRIGDTAECKINGKSAQVMWQDADTLVLNGTDARRIGQSV